MKRCNRKCGFTLIEVVVAVSIMLVALGATGYIFKVGTDAYKLSEATNEIMSTMRAVTDQINADFAGYRKDGPVYIMLQPTGTMRADRILFASAGDFQSVRTYKKTTGTTNYVVSGDLAIITYALADRYKKGGATGLACPENPLTFTTTEKCKNYVYGPRKILVRRQTIFLPSNSDFQDPCTVRSDPCEYCKGAYPNWRQLLAKRYPYPSRPNRTDVDNITRISYLDANDGNQVPLVLAKGVEDFSIQVADRAHPFEPNGPIRWVDPNSDPTTGKSNVDYPVAIKFGFTIYSKTKINGKPMARRFTQIVWLRDE